MLKEISKHTNNNTYFNDDVQEWMYTKALQGFKNDYWEILSITTNLFCYYRERERERERL